MISDNCTVDDNVKWVSNLGEVRWLYIVDYHDFPLAGVVEWRGGRYWIEYQEWNWQPVGPKDEPFADWVPCAYFLYELTPEQWEAEDRRDSLFRECVGTHWVYQYDEDGGKLPRGKYAKTGREHEYYSTYPIGAIHTPKSGRLVAYTDESYLSVRVG